MTIALLIFLYWAVGVAIVLPLHRRDFGQIKVSGLVFVTLIAAWCWPILGLFWLHGWARWDRFWNRPIADFRWPGKKS